VLAFIVIGLIVAAISYVCFKCVKKHNTNKILLIEDAENNGSLLVDDDDQEQRPDRLSDDGGLAPEDM
jgi:biopolymer transport protein ExbB/TolQ